MDSLSSTRLDDATVLRAPAYGTTRIAGAVLALDPAAPNWIATDDRGARLLALFDGKTPLRDVVARYAADVHLDVTRAWLHVETFARDALRQRFFSSEQFLDFTQTDHLRCGCTGCPRSAHFFDHAALKHSFHSSIDSFVKLLPVAEHENACGRDR